MKQTMRKYPLVVALIALAIGIGSIYIPTDTDMAESVMNIILTAIMLAIMIQMGAGDSLRRVTQGAGHTFRKSLYVLILSFLMGAVVVLVCLVSNTPASEDAAARLLGYFILCISIGLFEESLFRGVVLEALARKLGGTRKGVVGAVLCSALIFGVAHVIPYIVGGNYDVSGVVQALLKVVQSGAFGVLLATLYLQNKNLWSIVLVHALSDFFPMMTQIFRDASEGSGGYVSSGADGTRTIITFSIYLILYIPPMISSARMLKKMDVPEYGIFESAA